ncbi:hypothetical protein BOX15_Mlig023783g1, partial [Macrostomum lignano]
GLNRCAIRTGGNHTRRGKKTAISTQAQSHRSRGRPIHRSQQQISPRLTKKPAQTVGMIEDVGRLQPVGKHLQFLLAIFMLLLGCQAGCGDASGAGGIYRWACDRVPDWAIKEPEIGDGGYELQVQQLNDTPATGQQVHRFEPGATYRVVIKTRYPGVVFNNFYLTAVKQSVSLRSEYMHGVGQFRHLPAPVRTQSDPECPGVVTGIESARRSNQFTQIQVHWTAPYSSGGMTDCVSFRATVEYDREYFKDQGMLTKDICPTLESHAPMPADQPRQLPRMTEADSSGTASGTGGSGTPLLDMMMMRRRHIEECCACGHAVYRMEMRGVWTRHNHPNEFPTEKHDSHWTSIIGVTHSQAYNIFYIGGKAKAGVKAVCETGDTTQLEKEFKEKGRWNILNVIKTHGLWGEDNLGDTRTALFSVNRTHHLLSFLTMLGPSPDWCAGTDDLDLCQTGCTWKREIRIPLYPWDAGTKTGSHYHTRDARPEDDVIRYLGRSGFYKKGPFQTDDTGRARPVAELVVTRTRPTHDWVCEDAGLSGNERPQSDRPPSGASAASSGSGRRRSEGGRREPLWRAQNRREGSLIDTYPDMIQKKMRMKCLVSPWGSWSACSSTCGSTGVRRRERRLETNLMEGQCERLFHLNETEICTPAELSCQYSDCAVNDWSSWSVCVAECNGNGEQERYRSLYTPDKCPMARQREIQVREVRGCRRQCNARDICIQEYDEGRPCSGGEGRFYYYNIEARSCHPFNYRGCKGNTNRFTSEEACLSFCKKGLSNVSARDLHTMAVIQKGKLMARRGLIEPCKQPSDSGRTCEDGGGTGTQVKWYFDLATKRCIHFSYNGCGGNDNRYDDKMQCERQCGHHMPQEMIGKRQDCVVSAWGPWGPCARECAGERTRTRRIEHEPANGGLACPSVIDQSACPACCQYSDWSRWSSCSRTCNFMNLPSIKERRRQRLTPRGQDCTARTIVERQECREFRGTPCPGSGGGY